VQCSAVQCSAVQCSAVQCSAVQCSAVQCSAVVGAGAGPAARPIKLRSGRLAALFVRPSVCISAMLCSAEQCSAVQCSAVQCSAVYCPECLHPQPRGSSSISYRPDRFIKITHSYLSISEIVFLTLSNNIL
jgi:hypothetical protein